MRKPLMACIGCGGTWAVVVVCILLASDTPACWSPTFVRGVAADVVVNGTATPQSTASEFAHTNHTRMSRDEVVCNATTHMTAQQWMPCTSPFSDEQEAHAAAAAGLVHGAMCNISTGLTWEACPGGRMHECLVGHVRLVATGGVVARVHLSESLSGVLVRDAAAVNCSDVTPPVEVPALPQWWTPEGGQPFFT